MVASLSVLAPITVTDAMLFSSTVAETDYPAYVATTTYGQSVSGALVRVISTVTHRVYESLKAGNVGHDPTDVLNRTGTSPWWQDIGPTSRWAMFDGEVSTQTAGASPLTVVLRPGYFNALYLAALEADNVTITVRDAPAGNVIYSFSGPLEDSMPGDYYEHFFDRFKPQTDFLASDIDPYNNMEVTLTVTRVTGQVKIGVMALGDLRPLGLTQYGAKAKPKTFSSIKLDEFGNNVIRRRKSAKDMSASAYVKLEEANTVNQTLMDTLDVPCVWIGSGLPEYGGLRVYGLGSGELSYDQPQDCLLTLDVKGLI